MREGRAVVNFALLRLQRLREREIVTLESPVLRLESSDLRPQHLDVTFRLGSRDGDFGIAKLQVAVLRAALRLLPAPSAADDDDAAAVWRRRAKSALAVGAVALLALAVFLAGGASVPRFPLSPADGPLSPMRPAPVPPGAGRLPFNSRPFLDNMARKLVV